MQRAEEPSRLASEPERSGLRPVVAFLLLLVVIAIIGVVALLTRADPAPPGTTESRAEPTFALTDEEAITRFKELHQLELTAYRNADPSLVDEVFTPDSPIAPTVRREIRILVRDDVVARPEYSNQSISVLRTSYTEIEFEQVATVESHFFGPDGREITTDDAHQRQTIRWTMRLVDSSWLLHDAVITKAGS